MSEVSLGLTCSLSLNSIHFCGSRKKKYSSSMYGKADSWTNSELHMHALEIYFTFTMVEL